MFLFFFFFFNDTATTEIYTLSLHDALPICVVFRGATPDLSTGPAPDIHWDQLRGCQPRSEEHTSELQSQSNLVCRLLLEKKKKKQFSVIFITMNTIPYVVLTAMNIIPYCLA